MDYGFEFEGKVYTPNRTTGIDPAENEARNRAIQAQELEAWSHQPDHMVGYYNLATREITTWLGSRIGRILHFSTYRHNMGSRFLSLRMRGTNGAEYWGRASLDHGSSITLHKAKHPQKG